MDSLPNCVASAPPAQDSVDPFLKEALQNPRHRLTVLRMELDIQMFMQNPDQHQFEFQPFPTSYLRLATHRVAQHYGLQSIALDNGADGSGSRVVVRKTTESKYPTACLSEIGCQQPENEKHERIKIAIRPRLRASSSDGTGGVEQGPVRTVEERKEEYDRARARIFSSSSSPNLEGVSSLSSARRLSSSKDERGSNRATTEEPAKMSPRESSASKVAFSETGKRTAATRIMIEAMIGMLLLLLLWRYVKSLTPKMNFAMGAFTMHLLPFVQYETGFPQLGYLPRTRTSVRYGPTDPIMVPFCTVGSSQIPRDADVYLHWPGPSTMYAHPFEHLRHTNYQPPFYQKPLSFEYSQNY